MSAITIGCMVKLKGQCGPWMTVNKIVGRDEVEVAWFVAGDSSDSLRREVFSAAALDIKEDSK